MKVILSSLGDDIVNKVLVKNIYMNYHSLKGSTSAIKDISFSIKEGEFVSIVGPSGCGKSTLLNIIAGLIPASSGEVYIDDEKQNSISPKIGYMFQKDHLFQWLTVWHNVTLGLKIQHKLNNKNKQFIEELLENYGLSEFKNHHPDELSGGMRQKVALIRTLALNPEVLLLDEPFSALDYQTRLNIGDEIYKIIKKEGKTALMVTHDISEAVAMSDRVLVLSNRPAKLKNEINIELSTQYDSPLKCREAPEFRVYFNNVWKELNTL